MLRRVYDPTEYEGIALVQDFFRRELKWGFREQPPPDAGIDVQVETVVEGRLSGKLLGIQVKAGPSYLVERTDSGFVYRGDRDHLDYWRDHSLPVIIVLCDLEQNLAYWQHVTKEKAEATGKGWKTSVPFDQVLSGKWADALQRIAHRGRPFSRFAVRFPRHTCFLGREDELATLHDLLRGGKPVGVVGLVGFGGIGKTQLAVEYAHAHRGDYDGGVYWVNAADGLLDGMVDCADNAGMCEWDADRSKLDVRTGIAERLYRWLRDNPDSLLIVDNIAEPGDLRRPLLRHEAVSDLPCQVLFTTRNDALQTTDFARLPVDVLPREVSLQLLLGDQYDLVASDAEQWRDAQEICGMLGGVALVVKLVGASIRAQPEASLSDHRDRLRDAVGLLTAPRERETRYEMSLAESLRRTIEELAPSALLTLRVLAEFPENEMVPRHRVGLAAGLSHEPQGGRPEALSVAVEELKAVSLVDDLEGGRLRLHPAVREFVRTHEWEVKREALRQQIAAHFASGLGDVAYLERRVKAEGIYAVLEDFLAVDGIMPREGEAAESVRGLYRLLDRESHHLRDWNSETLPAFFLQLILNGAEEMGLVDMRHQAEQIASRSSLPLWLRRIPHRRSQSRNVQPLRVLSGHEGKVLGVTFSRDGQHLASGSSDGTVRLWDTASGRETARLAGHTAWVRSVAFSPDGRWLVSGSADGTTRLWSVEDGREVASWAEPGVAIFGTAFSPDGKRVLCGGAPRALFIWDPFGADPVIRLDGAAMTVWTVSFSPDGAYIAAGAGSNSVGVWSLVQRQLVRVLEGHSGPVRSVAFSPSGSLLASGAGDDTVRVWDVDAQQEVAAFGDHRQGVRGVAFLPDDVRVAAALADGTVLVLDARKCEVLTRLGGVGGPMHSVAVSADGRYVASGSAAGTISLWDAREWQAVGYPRAQRPPRVWSAAISHGGERIAFGLGRNSIQICEFHSHRELLRLTGSGGWVACVAFSRDDLLLAAGCSDALVRLWSASTGEETLTLAGHERPVSSLVFSFDGRAIASGSNDGTVVLWGTREGEVLKTLRIGAQVKSLSFSPDGSMLAAGGSDGLVRIWEAATGKPLGVLRADYGGVGSLDFSPDGRWLAAGYVRGAIQLWAMGTMLPVQTLLAHTKSVRCLAFSPCAQRLASGSADPSLRVWDISIGKESGHYPTIHPVVAIRWSPDARIIKAADRGGPTNRPHIYELELVDPGV